jgi:hypothetical protein
MYVYDFSRIIGQHDDDTDRYDQLTTTAAKTAAAQIIIRGL